MSPETAIATIAILVSLWNLWLWYQARQPRLSIEVKNGVLPPRRGGYMIVTVRNQRSFKTQVVGLSMPVPGTTDTMFFPGIEGQDGIPCTLQGFHSTVLWIPLPEIADVLKSSGLSGSVDVAFEIEAGSGHKYKGNGSLLVDEWAGKS